MARDAVVLVGAGPAWEVVRVLAVAALEVRTLADKTVVLAAVLFTHSGSANSHDLFVLSLHNATTAAVKSWALQSLPTQSSKSTHDACQEVQKSLAVVGGSARALK